MSIALLGPDTPQRPVILSVPHSGRNYPIDLLARSRLTIEQLRVLEDRYVDRLVNPLAAQGFSIIVAKTARAWIDLNRSENEIDPDSVQPRMRSAHVEFSAKARGGLGLVPTRLARHGDIYRKKITQEDMRSRIAADHRPYHAALSDLLAKVRARFGQAVLLDCHSMPPLRTRSDEPKSDIVIGDRRGESAEERFALAAVNSARADGYSVARNRPYAGGYILARHGKPGRAIHAVQLEICRSTYLDAGLLEPGRNFETISTVVGRIADALSREALEFPESIAAE